MNNLSHEEMMAAAMYMYKEQAKKEKKRNRRFLVVCNVLAGANLASGNILGWAVCTGIGFLPMLRR